MSTLETVTQNNVETGEYPQVIRNMLNVAANDAAVSERTWFETFVKACAQVAATKVGRTRNTSVGIITARWENGSRRALVTLTIPVAKGKGASRTALHESQLLAREVEQETRRLVIPALPAFAAVAA